MIITNLVKMTPELNIPVKYFMRTKTDNVLINDLLGEKIRLTYLHRINCIKCGRQTKTSFAQGYCYPCFISIPETEECVLRPELCQAQEGIARNMEFAKANCLIDHFVYLAESGGLKVGVTRHTNIPERWIDQGAKKALKIALAPNRYIAGTIEVALKNILSDKTNWRDMLTNKDHDEINLYQEKENALMYLHPDFRKYSLEKSEIISISYPVLQYPKKVKTLNFDKTDDFEDVLTGIKGQYLLFESGYVLNIRKHSGYLVHINRG